LTTADTIGELRRGVVEQTLRVTHMRICAYNRRFV